MNKFIVFFGVVFLLGLSSCSLLNNEGGELIGANSKGKYLEPIPYGMVLVPSGSFTQGINDQDATWALNSQSKRVSVGAFWMDDTEITNNEYRQFVEWVRDSIARTKLGEQFDEYLNTEDENGNLIEPPTLNWNKEIDWNNEEYSELLDEMYVPEHERFSNRKEIDARKLNYSFQWVDFKQAAILSNRYNSETGEYEGLVDDYQGGRKSIEDRSSFIIKETLNIYPDTLSWIHDYTYSYNEPLTEQYFWHPSFDDYPVVGVNWKQARAFCYWRTQFHNSALKRQGKYPVPEYRLPTETEWEYAARGGVSLNLYPWGGDYTRNDKGCFLANFKPLRGSYSDDGGFVTLPVGTYEPNGYGLYDMAGNVAEWTSAAYAESAYSFTHDMNPNYQYNALPSDPPALKRKVVRGGSWKDVGYFLQCGVSTYEYQDTAKCFIGFRCVRTRHIK